MKTFFTPRTSAGLSVQRRGKALTDRGLNLLHEGALTVAAVGSDLAWEVFGGGFAGRIVEEENNVCRLMLS